MSKKITVVFHEETARIYKGDYTHTGPEPFLVNPKLPVGIPMEQWKKVGNEITAGKTVSPGFFRAKVWKPVDINEKLDALKQEITVVGSSIKEIQLQHENAVQDLDVKIFSHAKILNEHEINIYNGVNDITSLIDEVNDVEKQILSLSVPKEMPIVRTNYWNIFLLVTTISCVTHLILHVLGF